MTETHVIQQQQTTSSTDYQSQFKQGRIHGQKSRILVSELVVTDLPTDGQTKRFIESLIRD